MLGPFRVFPGRLSVSRAFGNAEAKITEFGGIPNVIIAVPQITSFQISSETDFIILGCDGVYDKLTNEEIMKSVWLTTKAEYRAKNIHSQCSYGIDIVLKTSLLRRTFDNVTCIMIAFENLEKLFIDKEVNILNTNPKEEEIIYSMPDFNNETVTIQDLILFTSPNNNHNKDKVKSSPNKVSSIRNSLSKKKIPKFDQEIEVYLKNHNQKKYELKNDCDKNNLNTITNNSTNQINLTNNYITTNQESKIRANSLKKMLLKNHSLKINLKKNKKPIPTTTNEDRNVNFTNRKFVSNEEKMTHHKIKSLHLNSKPNLDFLLTDINNPVNINNNQINNANKILRLKKPPVFKNDGQSISSFLHSKKVRQSILEKLFLKDNYPKEIILTKKANTTAAIINTENAGIAANYTKCSKPNLEEERLGNRRRKHSDDICRDDDNHHHVLQTSPILTLERSKMFVKK